MENEEQIRMHQIIDADRGALTDAICRLVRIRSVEGSPTPGHPYGDGPAACLDSALALADELGFRTHNMDYHCGWAEYGEGPEMIAVLGHLDVVPEADGWDPKTQPYEPVILDGKLYGRGAIDDKGPTAAALFALKAVRDAGIPLKRRVRLLFGCNEETGAADMKYYRAHGGELPVMGFTPDGEFPLINGEKGILNEVYEKTLAPQHGPVRLVSLHGGVAGNVVPESAVAELQLRGSVDFPKADRITVETDENTVRITASGTSAHGSTPEKGDNAVVRLLQYLAANVPLSGDTAETVADLAKTFADVHGEGLGCPLRDDVSGQFTCCFGILHLERDCIRIRLNYRYPVTKSAEDCQPIVRKHFESRGWSLASSLHKPKLYFPEDDPMVTALLQVYYDATGDPAGPKSIGGGTYAKAIPNILAFGPVFPGDPVVEHLPNEYVQLDQLIKTEKIIGDAIVALANA